MASLLTPVKGKLFIDSTRKSTHALDGAYASLLRGHSLDFDDLRAYEYGDQIRDIDWKATARLGSPVVRRSLATRMHTVLFVVDTGLSMAALAYDERPKKELAILTVGVLGLLALRHGDDFCLVDGDSSGVRRREIGRSEAALEHTLRRIDRAVDEASAPSDRDALLSYVARTIARRMIVVVLTDDAPVGAETERLLRRLRVQHDVLWITLRDAEPVLDPSRTGTGAGRRARAAADLPASPQRARRDVASHWAIPEFLQGDAELAGELHAVDAADAAHTDTLLRRLEITHVALAAQDAAVGELLAMLDARSHVRHG
ncbi:DUF58 domain-containing protein [Microbacterium azadirachtae]|uniref:DUF58 domain-containing protein n=1 Tax=Microbacterium azadirachtae TaxID=582680 RepID=A0A0F0LLM8_9MICO|nr:DUF58 domain-containing protein [Microbacterium azadirachtae]KJL32431.1 hypothetical protein RL72_00173 [Microbacterium azadirachtae]UXW86068.1 DUF58 domain-containing protein [Microbacterium azadirachtae]SDL64113.1 Protein of unknown function DUF58 [Microbacterium azadirachtae]SEF93355.1 Protein of unknown function DUF58 [Microbacterium azadirachtae]SEF95777.1 Protein of unknown function DUF58 [Microbacterium azadirachtae]